MRPSSRASGQLRYAALTSGPPSVREPSHGRPAGGLGGQAAARPAAGLPLLAAKPATRASSPPSARTMARREGLPGIRVAAADPSPRRARRGPGPLSSVLCQGGLDAPIGLPSAIREALPSPLSRPGGGRKEEPAGFPGRAGEPQRATMPSWREWRLREKSPWLPASSW
jgi:hypothetical protein